MKVKSYAVELNLAQVRYLKRAFKLKSDSDVRRFLEQRVRQMIDRARKRDGK